MSGGHAHAGYVERASLLHHLAPHRKIVAVFVFILAVVAVPRGVWWPYFVATAALVAVAGIGQIPARFIARRMLIEIPFVLFALLLPFFVRGPRVEVFGISLSESGLVAGGVLLAKATIGVVAAIELAATTRPRELVAGLHTLRLPTILIEILSFMLRYIEVISDDIRRMRIARESRCFQGRHLGHMQAVAASAGALFIRSYERGERVHLAMLSRGYAGAMPSLAEHTHPHSPQREWLQVSLLPAVAILAAAWAWMMQ